MLQLLVGLLTSSGVGESQRNCLHSMFRSWCAHRRPSMSQHGRPWRTDRGSCSCDHRRRLNRARAIKAASGVTRNRQCLKCAVTGCCGRTSLKVGRAQPVDATPSDINSFSKGGVYCTRKTGQAFHGAADRHVAALESGRVVA